MSIKKYVIMTKPVLSIKGKCPKCGVTAFHTLVDRANIIYRCNICGNLMKKK